MDQKVNQTLTHSSCQWVIAQHRLLKACQRPWEMLRKSLLHESQMTTKQPHSLIILWLQHTGHPQKLYYTIAKGGIHLQALTWRAHLGPLMVHNIDLFRVLKSEGPVNQLLNEPFLLRIFTLVLIIIVETYQMQLDLLTWRLWLFDQSNKSYNNPWHVMCLTENLLRPWSVRLCGSWPQDT